MTVRVANFPKFNIKRKFPHRLATAHVIWPHYSVTASRSPHNQWRPLSAFRWTPAGHMQPAATGSTHRLMSKADGRHLRGRSRAAAVCQLAFHRQWLVQGIRAVGLNSHLSRMPICHAGWLDAFHLQQLTVAVMSSLICISMVAVGDNFLKITRHLCNNTC